MPRNVLVPKTRDHLPPPPSPLGAPVPLFRIEADTVLEVRVFQMGHFNNGANFGMSDLTAMAEAAPAVGFAIPLKVSHSTEPGLPAHGFVINLRRKGVFLHADFEDVSPPLLAAIANRRFRTISAEVFFNLKRDGKVFRHVLKSVAILGTGISDTAFST